MTCWALRNPAMAVTRAAPAVQGSGSGQGDGAAQSAADDSGILEACDVAGAAQRAGEGGQGITGPEGIQQQGGAAHHLVDDGDGSGLGVKIRDGEGDALAVFGGAEDDELAGGGMAATSGAERTMRLMPGARVSLRRMGAFMERLLPFGGEIGRAPKSRREKTERRKVRKDLLSGCRPKRGAWLGAGHA